MHLLKYQAAFFAAALSYGLLSHAESATGWPTETWSEAALPKQAEATRVVSALQGLFDSQNRAGIADHRALLVVHQGAIVTETYAPGYDETAASSLGLWQRASPMR